MDLSSRLRSVLARIHLAEREMTLLPEVFHATAELHLAAGDLARLIADYERTVALTSGAPRLVGQKLQDPETSSMPILNQSACDDLRASTSF
jgi:hypothetical protein